MFHLNRKSPIPLYFQIKLKLLERIENGEFAVGKLLPTEMELMSKYSVSRATVRRVMQDLEKDGFINRTAGKGTFVIRSKINRELTHLTSFTEDMKHLGKNVSSKILKFQIISAQEPISEKFGLPLGSPLLYISRLRNVDGEPIAINISYLNLPENIQISKQEVDEAGSIYALLERKGIPPMESDRTLEAIEANEERARILNIQVGSPLMMVEGLVYTYNEFPVEFHQVISIGKRYKYSLHLQR
jgi:GntR family transcriptional regulator